MTSRGATRTLCVLAGAFMVAAGAMGFFLKAPGESFWSWSRWWAPSALVMIAAAVGILAFYVSTAVVERERERVRVRASVPYYGFPPETPPDGGRKETTMRRIVPVIALFVALPLVAACATRQYDPRPSVIFVPPAERAAPQEKLPPRVEGAQNPCGIPAPIVEFVGAGNKAIFNKNMPPELRFVTGDWARCAGGVLVDAYNAPLVFEWGYNVETVNVSTFNAYGGSIGGFIAGRITRGLEAVADGFTINGQRLGGGSGSVSYVQRVTIWFFLTGTDASGARRLAFQGRGAAAYLDGASCGRQCGFETAAVRALKNMH